MHGEILQKEIFLPIEADLIEPRYATPLRRQFLWFVRISAGRSFGGRLEVRARLSGHMSARSPAPASHPSFLAQLSLVVIATALGTFSAQLSWSIPDTNLENKNKKLSQSQDLNTRIYCF
jgi:hypothetical protein